MSSESTQQNITNETYGALLRQPENQNFLLDNKFAFTLRKIPNCKYFIQAVSIPGIKLGVAKQLTPFQTLPLPGTEIDFDELSVTFKVDENFKNWIEINRWMQGLGLVKDFSEYASIKKENIQINSEFGGIWSDAIIHVLSNESNPLVNIIFRDAFPTSLSSVDFDSRTDEPKEQIATVKFTYAYFDFEYVT